MTTPTTRIFVQCPSNVSEVRTAKNRRAKMSSFAPGPIDFIPNLVIRRTRGPSISSPTSSFALLPFPYPPLPLIRPPQPFDVDPRYASLKYIGAGAYGCVASAVDEASGRRVAIKKVARTLRDLTDAKRILRELKLLRFLGGHDNLVFVTDCSVSPPGPKFVDTYIVTELFDSDLHRIIDSTQVLSENHVKYFLVRRDPHAAIASFSHQPPQPHRPALEPRFAGAAAGALRPGDRR
jgi:serine/threonine protein kinase